MKTKLALIIITALCICASAFAGGPYDPAHPPIRPDPVLSPGGVLTNVTVEQITTRGYANVNGGGVRHVTEATKRQVFIRYFAAVPARPGAFEVDHLVSLELGGNNEVANLWPESYTGPWNAHVKDALENRMAALVRRELQAHGHDAATAMLARFQHEIATDWIAAWKLYVVPPLKTPKAGK